MKELINQETIAALKKSKLFIVLEIIISLVLTAGIIILLLFFTNRENRFLMALALATVCAIESGLIIYTLTTSLFPLLNYQKLCKNALEGNKYETNALVIEIVTKVRHVKGVAVRQIKVRDLNEDKDYSFFIEDNNDISEIKLGDKYRFITYQSVVVKYENL